MKLFTFFALLSLAIGTTSCSDIGSQSSASYETLVAKFDIVDSTGQTKRRFRTSENPTFIFLVINESSQPQAWHSAMTYSLTQFLVIRGDSTFGDSFYGFAFLAMPIGGSLAPGDTMKSTWRAVGNISPLHEGEYTAVSRMMIVFPDGHLVDEQRLTFSITQ